MGVPFEVMTADDSGALVGAVVGSAVGAVVGSVVGAVVGSVVGATDDGSVVGTTLDSSAAEEVGELDSVMEGVTASDDAAAMAMECVMDVQSRAREGDGVKSD